MKTGLWALAALLSLSMTAAADVEVTEEMTFDVNPGARVSLENINGDITITGGSGDQVKVTAHKKAGKQEYLDELKVVTDADADYVRIETRHPKSESNWFNWGGDGGGSDEEPRHREGGPGLERPRLTKDDEPAVGGPVEPAQDVGGKGKGGQSNRLRNPWSQPCASVSRASDRSASSFSQARTSGSRVASSRLRRSDPI